MKRALAMVLTLSLAMMAFTGCSSPKTNETAAAYELALITDVGTIDDKSFNQGTWEGVQKYSTNNNVASKYYKPVEKTTDAYLDSIDLAVKNGAKVVLCPGFLFEQAVFQAQTKYPEVKFVILDGAPHNGDNNIVIADNTYSIFYAEEESGFLAGYAAVKEGYRKLGFMGGIAVPAVIRFGYGFVQGADYAARELGLPANALDVKYTYVGNFDASPENQTIASSWYNEGTEVIFACGGGVGNSVMAAAEASGNKVIGVDVDQSGESDTVITSALKELGNSAYGAIDGYYNNTFPGGKSESLDITASAVGLPMETSRFTKFTNEEYQTIYNKLVDNIDGIRDSIVDNTGAKLASDIKTTNTKVTVVK